MHPLDHPGPTVTAGTNGVWLGLGDPLGEFRLLLSASFTPRGVSDVRVFCGGCLVAGGPRFLDEPGAAERLARDPAFAGWPLVVLTDEPARAARSDMNFLWTTFTRFEPGADIHAAERRIVRNHIAYRAPIVIDARMKPSYPKELVADEVTSNLVTGRWTEYFPDRRVEMGDSTRGHLD
jgi:hypothetical protein